MKKLFAITMMLFIFTVINANNKDGSPASMDQIESKHAAPPSFKYYYDAGDMSFGVLGYWQESKGVVYIFTKNQLVEEKTFNDYKEFAEYLNPKDKKLAKNIIIPLQKNNKG